MLYLRKTNMRLALKLFRGEPAISGFDWNFSPTHTSSPPFQRMCVRSSIAFYGNFNLDMGRSPGFGSAPTDCGPIKTWFPFGSGPSVLNLASQRNSPDRSTKSTRFMAMDSPIPAKQCGWIGGEYKDVYAGVVVYAE